MRLIDASYDANEDTGIIFVMNRTIVIIVANDENDDNGAKRFQ